MCIHGDEKCNMEKVAEGQDQLVIMPYMETRTNTDKGRKSKNVNRSLLHPLGVHPKEVIDVGGRQITKIDYD